MESLSKGEPLPCTEQEIIEELERVLASRDFSQTDRLSRFLRHVVERTLAGDRESLKESVIGAEVYDRSPGYDPKAEPIVRTEARRLRTKLAQHYQNSGRDARIQISIPTGAYVAAFTVCEPTPARLAVVPKRPPDSNEASTDSPPQAKAAWRGWRLAVILLLMAAAGALAIWQFGPRSHLYSEFTLSTVTSYPGSQYTPAISPDGRQVAFAWSEDPSKNADLYVVSADGGSPKRLTTAHAADTFPAWSHDGTKLAFIRAGNLMMMSPSGGGERAIGSAFPSWISWSPSGNSLVVSNWAPDKNVLAVFAVDEATGARRQLTFPPARITGDTAGSLSPDGARLAFIRCNLANCDLYTMPGSGGAARRLTRDECSFAGLSWTPDGNSIVYSSRRRGPYMLWQVDASGGSPQAVASSGDDARYPTAARGASGKPRIVFERRVSNSSIWRQRLTPESAPQRLIASTRIDSSPQLSPDGKSIVFGSDRTGYDEIWAADAEGGNQRALTHLREQSGSPRWSPDGNRIAFDLMTKNGRAIFLTDTNGATPQQWTPWGNAGRPSWSRDGRFIYFGADDPEGHSQVWKISTAPDRAIVQVTHDGGFEAYESLDGRTLFYNKGTELRRMPTAGGAWTRVATQPVRHGWWSISQIGIYLADLPEPKSSLFYEPFSVLFLDPSSGSIRRVAEIKGPIIRNTPDFAVSADGRTLVYCLLETSTSQIRMVEAL